MLGPVRAVPKGALVAICRVKRGLWALVLLALTGCGPMDDADTVRQAAQRWVFAGQVSQVLSERDCTAARLTLSSDQLRYSGGAVVVNTVRSGLPYLEAGRAVAFVVPGATPNQVSERLMSIRLFEGLGLLGSFLGPGRRCMDEDMADAAYHALMSPDVVMIYDPESYAILLMSKPDRSAFYLRTRSW